MTRGQAALPAPPCGGFPFFFFFWHPLQSECDMREREARVEWTTGEPDADGKQRERWKDACRIASFLRASRSAVLLLRAAHQGFNVPGEPGTPASCILASISWAVTSMACGTCHDAAAGHRAKRCVSSCRVGAVGQISRPPTRPNPPWNAASAHHGCPGCTTASGRCRQTGRRAKK